MASEPDFEPNLFLTSEAPATTIPVEQPDGSLELEELNDEPEDLEAGEDLFDFYDNLALYLTPDELGGIAHDVLEGMNMDDASRERHLDELAQGIEQLGLDDSKVEVPFEGACTVFHPLIMENSVKFQAKAEGELLPSNGPVRTQIIGQANEDLEKQAKRVKDHMNWQLVEQMPEFYTNGQKGLLQTALFGDSFKKNYFDPIKGRPCDYLIPIDQLVVNSACASLDEAERITEIQYISETEFLKRQYSGQYSSEVDLGEPYTIEKNPLGQKIDNLLGFDNNLEGYEIIEQHVFRNLEGFEHEAGIPQPYIITIEKQTSEVLSIRRNWNPKGNEFEKRTWFTQYPFVPGFGFYNLGYIHLLGNFQNTLTAIMRSLVDAGSFANMQGGIKSKALRIIDDSPVGPGEYRDAEFYGQDISKLIHDFNFKEPSATLAQILEWLESRGQKYADSAEQVVADAANYGPVGTTMALLDASTKFFSTVFKRLHSAQKKQLRIIASLNLENLPEDPSYISYNILGQDPRIIRQDYDQRVDIIPISDPNIPSAAHRVTLASQKLQSALQAPDLHDLREAYKQYYIALGDENYEKYLPPPQQAQPMEPLQDINAAINGQAIAAFPDQDHDAHISIKTAFINDPTVLAQNQLFAQAIPALQANIRQHVAMRFASQFKGAQKLGLNSEQAAQEISQFNQYKAQNPLGQMDPKQMLAQAEMRKAENEAKRIEAQERDQQIDALLEAAKLSLEAEKIQLDSKTKKDLAQYKEAMSLIKESLKPNKNKPVDK